MNAMRHGTALVAHATVGQRNAVLHRDEQGDVSLCVTFRCYSGEGVFVAVKMTLCQNIRNTFRAIQKRGMKRDLC